MAKSIWARNNHIKSKNCFLGRCQATLGFLNANQQTMTVTKKNIWEGEKTANKRHEFCLILLETILNGLSEDLSDASNDPLLF